MVLGPDCTITISSNIQVWNYDDLSMICIIGLDDLPADIACVSFSDLVDGKSYLSVIDASQNPNLVKLLKLVHFSSKSDKTQIW